MPFLKRHPESPQSQYQSGLSQLADASRQLGEAQFDRNVSGSAYYPLRDRRAALARKVKRLAQNAHIPDEVRETDIQYAYRHERFHVQQNNS